MAGAWKCAIQGRPRRSHDERPAVPGPQPALPMTTPPASGVRWMGGCVVVCLIAAFALFAVDRWPGPTTPPGELASSPRRIGTERSRERQQPAKAPQHLDTGPEAAEPPTTAAHGDDALLALLSPTGTLLECQPIGMTPPTDGLVLASGGPDGGDEGFAVHVVEGRILASPPSPQGRAVVRDLAGISFELEWDHLSRPASCLARSLDTERWWASVYLDPDQVELKSLRFTGCAASQLTEEADGWSFLAEGDPCHIEVWAILTNHEVLEGSAEVTSQASFVDLDLDPADPRSVRRAQDHVIELAGLCSDHHAILVEECAALRPATVAWALGTGEER